jgi:hypothetical protein
MAEFGPTPSPRPGGTVVASSQEDDAGSPLCMRSRSGWRLVGESFVGNVVTLVCEAKDRQELKVQLQQRALQHLSLRTNEDVKLTFDRQDTLIISAS